MHDFNWVVRGVILLYKFVCHISRVVDGIGRGRRGSPSPFELEMSFSIQYYKKLINFRGFTNSQ